MEKLTFTDPTTGLTHVIINKDTPDDTSVIPYYKKPEDRVSETSYKWWCRDSEIVCKDIEGDYSYSVEYEHFYCDKFTLDVSKDLVNIYLNDGQWITPERGVWCIRHTNQYYEDYVGALLSLEDHTHMMFYYGNDMVLGTENNIQIRESRDRLLGLVKEIVPNATLGVHLQKPVNATHTYIEVPFEEQIKYVKEVIIPESGFNNVIIL